MNQTVMYAFALPRIPETHGRPVRMVSVYGPAVAWGDGPRGPSGWRGSGQDAARVSSLVARGAVMALQGKTLTCVGGERRHAALHPVPLSLPITDQNTYD
jgi:hypothetical protein